MQRFYPSLVFESRELVVEEIYLGKRNSYIDEVSNTIEIFVISTIEVNILIKMNFNDKKNRSPIDTYPGLHWVVQFGNVSWSSAAEQFDLKSDQDLSVLKSLSSSNDEKSYIERIPSLILIAPSLLIDLELLLFH